MLKSNSYSCLYQWEQWKEYGFNFISVEQLKIYDYFSNYHDFDLYISDYQDM